MICSARKFSLALFTALAGLATNSPAQALFAASTSAVGLLQTDLAANTVALPQHPALSPDGRHIAFASQGDLWLVSSSGGVAARLTNHPATERRCEFSPDGRLLAFESDRDGGRNLYVLPLLSGPGGELLAGETRRVHVMDRAQSLSSFTPCGNYLLLNSNHEPAIYRGQRMYRVPVTGGPLERLTDAHGNMPRLSPEGDTLVFAYRRYDYNRPRYRGSGTSDLWSMNVPTGEFTQLTTHAADDADGFPLADGSIIFVSSRDGQNNLWRLPKGATDDQARQLTRFQPSDEISIGHGVRDLNVSADGRSAVFVVWDTLYTLDLSNPAAQPRALRLVTSSGANETDWNRTNIGREVSEAALSPDGKTIAVVARGEIFIRSTQENRPTRRLTSTSGRERDLAWSADNSTLYFVSDEGGVPRLYAATVAFSRDDLQPAKPAEPAEEAAPAGEEPAAAPDADMAERAEGSTEPEPADKPQTNDETPPKSDTLKSENEAPAAGKRWAESIRYTIHPVITGLESDEPCFRNGIFGIEISSPMPSADGEKLLFIRGRGDLVLHDLKTAQTGCSLNRGTAPKFNGPATTATSSTPSTTTTFRVTFILDTGNPEAAPVNVTRHPDIDDSPGSRTTERCSTSARSVRATTSTTTCGTSSLTDRSRR